MFCKKSENILNLEEVKPFTYEEFFEKYVTLML